MYGLAIWILLLILQPTSEPASNQALPSEIPQEIIPVAPEIPKIEEKEIEPEWQISEPLRNVQNLGKVLSDIESQMPAGHIYKDSDKITWGHETTHGINSRLRQKHHQTNARINCFYALDKKFVILQEPKCLIQRVSQIVPASLKGDTFQLYLVKSLKDWNDTPLYLCDEWIAYTNGSEVRQDLQIESRAETVQYMFEFNVYVLSMVRTAKASDPNYDDTNLKKFVQWNLARSRKLFKGEAGAEAYWKKFQTNSDAEELRKFTREYLGAAWCQRVLDI